VDPSHDFGGALLARSTESARLFPSIDYLATGGVRIVVANVSGIGRVLESRDLRAPPPPGLATSSERSPRTSWCWSLAVSWRSQARASAMCCCRPSCGGYSVTGSPR
jgi:hypothetical protein